MNSNHYARYLCLAAAMSFGAGTVQAEPMPTHGPIPFASYDTNGDGSISPQEFDQAHSQRMADKQAGGKPIPQYVAPAFADFDSNGDGKLTEQELMDGQRAHRQQMMCNRSGMGMQHGSHMPAFDYFDQDGDGKITAKELEAGHARPMHKTDVAGHPKMYMDDDHMMNMGKGQKFDDIDRNGDGGITPDELHQHWMEQCPQATPPKQ